MTVLALVADTAAEEPGLRNVAACLRVIADDIEAGKHGECIRAAVVLRCAGQEPIVFGPGDTNHPQVYMDLHAGAQQLMAMMNPGRS